MVVLYQLWLCLQFVNIVDSFGCGWPVRREFGWGVVDDDGVSIVVTDHIHQEETCLAMISVPGMDLFSKKH